MKDILDAANVWKGAPIGASFSSVNKPPVAIDDNRTVIQDSGPVIFVVLANDVDPEGQPKPERSERAGFRRQSSRRCSGGAVAFHAVDRAV